MSLFRVEVHHHHDGMDYAVRELIREVKHMAIDIGDLKGKVAALLEDTATLKTASDKAEADLDALKAKLDALVDGGGGATQAEVEALAADVAAASATLKAETADLKAASDRDNPPVIALADGKVGEPYSASLDVPDPAAVACVIQAGAVPPGTSIELETLAGTPTAAGDFSVTVWHIDAQSLHVGPQTTYTVKIVA